MGRIFEHYNTEGSSCPLCGTKEDKPCILVPISGTQDGNIMQARQIHVDCISEYTIYDEFEAKFIIVGHLHENYLNEGNSKT